MADTQTDVIDEVLGLKPGSALMALREKREKIKHLTQTSYKAALLPKEPRNFSYALRAALAARMAALWNTQELVSHYQALLDSHGGADAVRPVADKSFDGGDDARLRAILAHVDLVTRQPRAATRENIDKLYVVGLDDRDIVTLAGIIAYVNYQILVVAGLRMLRDH
ncbi:CMD domain-containing protein [Limoniibacter endophyticus]|uniref:CMD domain protein n=1 Tax=Limoniibacter endophyticus TaxID=1565040 RepID=A0A8J3GH82_9HYPH|nr:CMD domain protein [Limoniibacter endophyticus]GHC73100.1 hypothetical protein GCM10010136_21270 [Limoniibacter endophyticus]